MKWIWTWLVLVNAFAASAQTVTLTWDASPSHGVTEYRIYFGTNSGSYLFVTNAGLALTQAVELPHTGRWFFAATAVDANGLESDFSNEMEWEAKPVSPVLRGEPWVRLTPVIERSTDLTNWIGVAGVPMWFPATNSAEFFRVKQLLIERVQQTNNECEPHGPI